MPTIWPTNLDGAKEELEVYEYWGIKEQDERGAVEYAWKEGKREGKQEGKQEGQHEERLNTARRMLADGLDVAVILKYTGLSAEDVASLAD